MAVPGIIRQGIRHGLHHMGQGIQAHHVCRAVGGALGTANGRAREGIHLVKPQAQALGVVHHRQHGKYPHPVGDEIGSVLGPDHSFAQAAGEPGFQPIHHGPVGAGRGDDFHQGHVAGRIEKVDAAEAGAPSFRHGRRQGTDGKARGVGSQNGLRSQVGGDFPVQVRLPLHFFCDGFNDQIAIRQPFQMLVVIGGLDVGQPVRCRQGRRIQFFQPGQGFFRHPVGVSFRGGQIEEQYGDVPIGQMGGNLGPHYPGPQNGGTANDQTGHCRSPFMFWLCAVGDRAAARRRPASP